MIATLNLPIAFTDAADVSTFVETLIRYPYHMDMVSGRRIVDAKSLLGVIALTQSRHLQLIIHEDPSKVDKNLLADLKKFIPDNATISALTA